VVCLVLWRFRDTLSLRDLAEMFLQRHLVLTHAVDGRLSDTRALAAAEAGFRSAWAVTGVIPERMTTAGHDAYPRAIRNVFGNQVMHRTNRSLNNRIEQDQSGIKPRHRPMGGFKTLPTAARFCRLFDEIRGVFRPPSYRNACLSLHQRRCLHRDRCAQ
jgi:transposase-like protein